MCLPANAMHNKVKIVIVGAGPVGSLAALYAARRGHNVEVYELRPGISHSSGWNEAMALAADEGATRPT